MNDPNYNPYAPPAVTEQEPVSAYGYAQSGYFLASPGQRWLGAFLDNIVVAIPCIPMVIIAAVLDNDDLVLPLVGLPLVGMLILQTVLISKSGQSIGKRIIKTRIVRLDGSPPGFVHGVLLRSWLPLLLHVVPMFGSFFGLADALFVFRADRRTIHDHLAGTQVVQV